jgi:hypothetical protein
MKHPRISFILSNVALAALLVSMATDSADAQRRRLVTGETKGRMGGYDVVENWPAPLPDTDLSHDG